MASPSSKNPLSAVESSTPPASTRQEGFGFIPRTGENIYSVNPGLDRDVALDEAHLLLIGARSMVWEGFEEPLSPDKCKLLELAIEAAMALVSASRG